MKNKFYVPSVRLNRLAVVMQDDNSACVSFPGGDLDRRPRFTSVPKEDNMTADCYDLSDSDHEFIASLTGNTIHDRENTEVFGLSTVDSLERKGLRSLIEMVHFDVENDDIEEVRNWLRDNFKSTLPYMEAVLGKKATKKLLKAINKAKEGGDNKDLNPKTILGLDRPEPNERDWKPAKASYEEHRPPQGIHEADDGTMDDDKIQGRWKKNDDGSWSQTGYVIPYYRIKTVTVKKDEFGETTTETWDVKVIKNYKGEDMKVLNINYCMGEKPDPKKFSNLVIKSNTEEDYKQRVIAIKLLQIYRREMAERNPKIETCINGYIPVYYRVFTVEGDKKVTVFSPVPQDDQTEEFKAKRAQFFERQKIWNDTSLVQ